MEEYKGFIQIHRQMVNWEWYDDTVTKCVFLHLLLTANFKATKWHGVNLKPGELIASYGSLANKLKMGVQQIRTAIDKLKLTGEITVKSTNRFSVITIVNWDKFQSNFQNATSKKTNRLTNKQQSTNKQVTNKQQQMNNDNNVNNENKSTLTRGLTPAGKYEDKPWCGTNERVF